ncbi:MAG: phosphoribosyl-AMP cyclohydrolase [Candidatus Omnitrophica bacterium]|nr:phosphoribosyl-AMP cyclohydrolase [Candidatus Omnitrophota bacterium]
MKTQDIVKELKFNKDGLIPAIIQDVENNEVLMLGYMNEKSFRKTLETKKVHFFSRSRKRVWLKGEVSGHFQLLEEILLDCDNDTLLLKVKQLKGACHKGYRSCFYRKFEPSSGRFKVIEKKVFAPKEVY